MRTIFALIFIACSALTSVMVLKRQMDLGPLTAKNIIGIIFFMSCCLNSVLIFKLSQKMRILMMCWMETEASLSSFNYKLPTTSWTLRKRIMFCLIAYLIPSTLEHVLYLTTNIHQLVHEIQSCKEIDIDPVEVFITRHLYFIVRNLPFHYNHMTGFIFEYLNFSYTFFWNFLDLLIILISIGIAYLYEKINWRLQNIKRLMVDESVWAEIRVHHVQVSELLNFINNVMGAIIIVAYFIDGYFILLQLLNITT